jgi:hypothetical protein
MSGSAALCQMGVLSANSTAPPCLFLHYGKFARRVTHLGRKHICFNWDCYVKASCAERHHVATLRELYDSALQPGMQPSACSKLCASLCIGSKGEPAATVLADPSIRGGSSYNSSPYVQPQRPYSPILVQGVLGKTAPVVPAVRSARVGASHAAISLLNHSTSAPSAYPPTAPAPCLTALCRRSRAAARASASTSLPVQRALGQSSYIAC